MGSIKEKDKRVRRGVEVRIPASWVCVEFVNKRGDAPRHHCYMVGEEGAGR